VNSSIASISRSAKGTRQQAPQRRLHRQGLRNDLFFWSFAAPLVIGLLVFTYIPLVWSIILSFFEARGTVEPTQFVGLSNYIQMLTDPSFRDALQTFTIFALFIIPTTFFLALALAVLVNSVSKGQGFFRTVFFIPTACSYVAASLIWKIGIFNGLPYGLANAVRGIFHLDPIDWIGTPNPPYYWLVLVTARLWLQLGFYMILFLAGLQDIPRELYEAAHVDGAKKGWTTFRYITFPLLRNTSVAVLLLNLIAAFQAFDEFYNIMGSFVGSSGNAFLARPPLVYLYHLAFGGQNFGLGSAGAMILTIIILFFTLLQGRVFGFGKRDL
jgi:multiple sugar transport system permease protein